MRFTVMVKMFGPDGEVIETSSYKLATKQEVDTKIMLLHMKYPDAEFSVTDQPVCSSVNTGVE